jgi:hypothetical protein
VCSERVYRNEGEGSDVYIEGMYLNEGEAAVSILLSEGEGIYLSETEYQSIDCI